MNLTQVFDELKKRSEKIKNEVLDEIVKSKTLNKIVSNKNFINAVSSIIATKQEVQKTLNKQITTLVKGMKVATKRDLSLIIAQLQKIEKRIDATSGTKRKSSKKKTASKKKKSSKKKAAPKKKK